MRCSVVDNRLSKMRSGESKSIRLKTVDDVITEWRLIQLAYADLKEKSSTTMEMYALRSAIDLVEDFIESLKDVEPCGEVKP